MSPTGPRPASASRGAPRSSYVVAPPTGGLRESGSALRARVFVGYRESMVASRMVARFVLTSESRYAAKRLVAAATSRTRHHSYSHHCLAFRVPYYSAYVSKRKARQGIAAWDRAFGSAPHVRSDPRNGRIIRVAEAVALRHRLVGADGADYPLCGFSVEYARIKHWCFDCLRLASMIKECSEPSQKPSEWSRGCAPRCLKKQAKII